MSTAMFSTPRSSSSGRAEPRTDALRAPRDRRRPSRVLRPAELEHQVGEQRGAGESQRPSSNHQVRGEQRDAGDHRSEPRPSLSTRSTASSAALSIAAATELEHQRGAGAGPAELEHEMAASSAHRRTLTGPQRVLIFSERATNGAARHGQKWIEWSTVFRCPSASPVIARPEFARGLGELDGGLAASREHRRRGDRGGGVSRARPGRRRRSSRGDGEAAG